MATFWIACMCLNRSFYTQDAQELSSRFAKL